MKRKHKYFEKDKKQITVHLHKYKNKTSLHSKAENNSYYDDFLNELQKEIEHDKEVIKKTNKNLFKKNMTLKINSPKNKNNAQKNKFKFEERNEKNEMNQSEMNNYNNNNNNDYNNNYNNNENNNNYNNYNDNNNINDNNNNDNDNNNDNVLTINNTRKNLHKSNLQIRPHRLYSDNAMLKKTHFLLSEKIKSKYFKEPALKENNSNNSNKNYNLNDNSIKDNTSKNNNNSKNDIIYKIENKKKCFLCIPCF